MPLGPVSPRPLTRPLPAPTLTGRWATQFVAPALAFRARPRYAARLIGVAREAHMAVILGVGAVLALLLLAVVVQANGRHRPASPSSAPSTPPEPEITPPARPDAQQHHHGHRERIGAALDILRDGDSPCW